MAPPRQICILGFTRARVQPRPPTLLQVLSPVSSLLSVCASSCLQCPIPTTPPQHASRLLSGPVHRGCPSGPTPHSHPNSPVPPGTSTSFMLSILHGRKSHGLTLHTTSHQPLEPPVRAYFSTDTTGSAHPATSLQPLLQAVLTPASDPASDPTPKILFTCPNSSTIMQPRPSCPLSFAKWTCDISAYWACSPDAFLFWSHLLVYHDMSLTGAYLAATHAIIDAKAYLRPASITRAFCKVIHDSTASSLHAFLQGQFASARRAFATHGPPLPPGFRVEFLDHQPCLTSFIKGKSWNTSRLPVSVSDLHCSFHPFYFLTTLSGCTTTRLPTAGLTITLAVDLIKNIQRFLWAISRVNILPGSATVSPVVWHQGILQRGLSKILLWLEGSSFCKQWSCHPLKYTYASIISILKLVQVVVRWIQVIDNYDTLSRFLDAVLPSATSPAITLLLPHAGSDLQDTLDQHFAQWLHKWDSRYTEYHTQDSLFPAMFLLSSSSPQVSILHQHCAPPPTPSLPPFPPTHCRSPSWSKSNISNYAMAPSARRAPHNHQASLAHPSSLNPVARLFPHLLSLHPLCVGQRLLTFGQRAPPL